MITSGKFEGEVKEAVAVFRLGKQKMTTNTQSGQLVH
jgi:hypothetical protein